MLKFLPISVPLFIYFTVALRSTQEYLTSSPDGGRETGSPHGQQKSHTKLQIHWPYGRESMSCGEDIYNAFVKQLVN